MLAEVGGPADLPIPGRKRTRGTDRVFPSKFVPPSPTILPLELFCRTVCIGRMSRYVHRDDKGTVLLRTDGACLNNGQANPRAGWTFWHGIGLDDRLLVAEGRLEDRGPFSNSGDIHNPASIVRQTSNRAELRAAIGALRFRNFPGEGFHTIVIGTDSEYVVEGCTSWVKNWIKKGWMTRNGPVKNKDLWEMLLGEIEHFKDLGTTVKFWRIPRDWNMVADAGNGAAKESYDWFCDLYGYC